PTGRPRRAAFGATRGIGAGTRRWPYRRGNPRGGLHRDRHREQGHRGRHVPEQEDVVAGPQAPPGAPGGSGVFGRQGHVTDHRGQGALMNGSDTFNTAGPHSFVGVQVGHVHDSDIYVVNPEDPPELDHEVGVRYLESGVPGKAREHLEHAHACGVDTPELHFHRTLAILSKRSYRDLDREDRTLLEELERRTETMERNEYGQALEVIFALLSCVDGSGGNSTATMARLKALPETQRAPILRHLGLVLTGGMKQELWEQIRRNAHESHLTPDRRDRVWSYFEPVPARARARLPAQKSFTGWDVFAGLALAAVTLPAIAIMLKNALAHGDFRSLVSCLAMLTLGPTAAWDLCSWHHKHRRRTALERQYGYLRSTSSPAKDGFTDRVKEAFDHYFFTYAPDPKNRDAWLKETEGVRRALREEVARTYR